MSEEWKIRLQRMKGGPEGIFGRWFDAQGNVICDTLEHAFEDRGVWRPLLPAGEWVVIFGSHTLESTPDKPFMTYEFPPFTGFDGNTHTKVLAAHLGNLDRDSRGCILVGDRQGDLDGQPAVLASADAFRRWLAVVGNEQAMRVRVDDIPGVTYPLMPDAGAPPEQEPEIEPESVPQMHPSDETPEPEHASEPVQDEPVQT